MRRNWMKDKEMTTTIMFGGRRARHATYNQLEERNDFGWSSTWLQGEHESGSYTQIRCENEYGRKVVNDSSRIKVGDGIREISTQLRCEPGLNRHKEVPELNLQTRVPAYQSKMNLGQRSQLVELVTHDTVGTSNVQIESLKPILKADRSSTPLLTSSTSCTQNSNASCQPNESLTRNSRNYKQEMIDEEYERKFYELDCREQELLERKKQILLKLEELKRKRKRQTVIDSLIDVSIPKPEAETFPITIVFHPPVTTITYPKKKARVKLSKCTKPIDPQSKGGAKVVTTFYDASKRERVSDESNVLSKTEKWTRVIDSIDLSSDQTMLGPQLDKSTETYAQSTEVILHGSNDNETSTLVGEENYETSSATDTELNNLKNESINTSILKADKRDTITKVWAPTYSEVGQITTIEHNYLTSMQMEMVDVQKNSSDKSKANKNQILIETCGNKTESDQLSHNEEKIYGTVRVRKKTESSNRQQRRKFSGKNYQLTHDLKYPSIPQFVGNYVKIETQNVNKIVKVECKKHREKMMQTLIMRKLSPVVNKFQRTRKKLKCKRGTFLKCDKSPKKFLRFENLHKSFLLSTIFGLKLDKPNRKGITVNKITSTVRHEKLLWSGKLLPSNSDTTPWQKTYQIILKRYKNYRQLQRRVTMATSKGSFNSTDMIPDQLHRSTRGSVKKKKSYVAGAPIS